jgi:hypothetical protein
MLYREMFFFFFFFSILWSCHTGDSPQGDLATFGYIPSLRCVHTWIKHDVTEMSSIGFVRFSATHLGQKVANSAALWLLRPLPHPPHPIPQHTHTHRPPSPSFCGLPKFQSRSPWVYVLSNRAKLNLRKEARESARSAREKNGATRTGPHTLIPN